MGVKLMFSMIRKLEDAKCNFFSLTVFFLFWKLHSFQSQMLKGNNIFKYFSNNIYSGIEFTKNGQLYILTISCFVAVYSQITDTNLSIPVKYTSFINNLSNYYHTLPMPAGAYPCSNNSINALLIGSQKNCPADTFCNGPLKNDTYR